MLLPDRNGEEINIQRNNFSLTDGPKVKGVEYLDDKEVWEYLRKINYFPVEKPNGDIISPSIYAMTDEEKEVLANSVIAVGEYAGMTNKEAGEARAVKRQKALEERLKRNSIKPSEAKARAEAS